MKEVIEWCEHIVIACMFTVIFHYAIGCAWAGVALGSGIFLGREHAQAEQRVIQNYYGNSRANSPFYCGFEPRAWDTASHLDWILPVLFSVTLGILFQLNVL